MNPAQVSTSFHASMFQAWSAFSDEFVAVWDDAGMDLLFFNDAYADFFGYGTRAEFEQAYSFFGCRKHKLDEQLEAVMRSSIQQHGVWTEEVLLEKEGGETFLGRMDIGAFVFDSKTYYLQRIINIDTQRVFSEHLFKEIKKFEALFRYATLPIVLVNRAGEIILANDQTTSLFGYTMSEIKSLKVEDLVPQRFKKNHHAHREHYGAHPENRPMGKGLALAAVKRSGEEFPVEISLGHYMIDNEPYVIAFIIDITKRVQAEATLRQQTEETQKAKQEIEQLNEELEAKVEARTLELTEALSKERELSDLKTRFVSMASHEFRTPLSTILSSVSLIAKYTATEDQDKRDKHILRIRSAVNNLTDILNEFLSLGRIEEGKIQVHYTEFNVKEQLQLILGEIQSILKNGQRIHYEHNGKTLANLDLSLVRNIVINLVSNAIKFSPEHAPVHVRSEVADDQLVIAIHDKGIGIPEEDKKHLFERFFRANNVTNIQGTGLGLHIVSRYIELMNGEIQVESELEKGTTFTIKFTI